MSDLMPAGKYYVGDLCYVMHPEWNEFCEDLDSNVNVKVVKGKKISSFFTKYGDGSYEDQLGNDYCVDSGSIGCILLSDIDPSELDNINGCGHIIDFPVPFYTSDQNSVLNFGHIKIDTDPRDYDSWDNDDDENDDDNRDWSV